MSRSLNKLTLLGNVGTNPEMRTISDGTKRVSIPTVEIRVNELIMLGGRRPSLPVPIEL